MFQSYTSLELYTIGSCQGVRRTKEGPGQAQNDVEMLMHRAWVTHHDCPLALEQSVMSGAGINVNPKKRKFRIKNKLELILLLYLYVSL